MTEGPISIVSEITRRINDFQTNINQQLKNLFQNQAKILSILTNSYRPKQNKNVYSQQNCCVDYYKTIVDLQVDKERQDQISQFIDPVIMQETIQKTQINPLQQEVNENDQNLSEQETKLSEITQTIPMQEFDIKEISHIFDNMKLTFRQATVLYQFPQMKQTNPHKLIDGIKNIFIEFLFQNNHRICLFTQMEFGSKPPVIPNSNPKCFLGNLTQKHFLYPSLITKTLVNDPNYLTVGNWELKIKKGQNKLISEIGTKHDTFRRIKFNDMALYAGDTREYIFGRLHIQKQFLIKKYTIFQLS